jgi:hypothetical protein
MHAAGTRNFLLFGEGESLSVMEKDEGGAVFLLEKRECGSVVTALYADEGEKYFLAGYADGSVKMHWFTEDGERLVCRFSLSPSSICAHKDVVYIASENGYVKALSIRPTYLPADAGSENEEIEIPETGSVATETSMGNMSKMNICVAVLREIKHTTPIVSLAVGPQDVFVLDMKRRVKVFPSGVVYDNISSIYMNKYLFSSEEALVYARTEDAFGSIYMAKGSVRAIKGSKAGGYLFVMSDEAIEMIEVKSAPKMVCSVKSKGLAFVVDDERQMLYIVEKGGSVVQERLPRDDLCTKQAGKALFRKREIEEVNADEEDEYREIRVRKIPYFEKGSKVVEEKGEEADPRVARLFEGEEDETDRTEERGMEGAPETSARRYGEYLYNGVAGPFSSPLVEKTSLSAWGQDVIAVRKEKSDHSLIEIKSVSDSKMFFVKDYGRAEKVVLSKNILGLVTRESVRVHVNSGSGFSNVSFTLFPRKSGREEEIRYVVCGEAFVATILGFGREVNSLRIYNVKGKEVYSGLFGKVCGISANGEYLALAHGSLGMEVVLFGVGAEVDILYRNRVVLEEMDFFFVSKRGVVFAECYRMFFAIGRDKAVPIYLDITGVPVAVLPPYLVAVKSDQSGKPILFPNMVADYIEIRFESLNKDSAPVDWVEEMAREIERLGSAKSSFSRSSDERSFPGEGEMEESAPSRRGSMGKEVAEIKAEGSLVRRKERRVEIANPFKRVAG